MNVSGYITQKFQTFGIVLSEAELLDIGLSSGLDMEDEVNADNYTRLMVSVTKFIPALLMRATTINENGFSMEWDVDGLKSYYSYLCKLYGLNDEINTDKPKVKFL